MLKIGVMQGEPRINTDEHGLRYAATTERIIGVFYQVYNELGYGFLESVYVKALEVALTDFGLSFHGEMPLQVRFRGHVVGKFRADVVVEGRVLLEIKACPAIQPIHQAQILNYLRATSLEVGLILNFGPRPEFRRLLLENTWKKQQSSIHPSVITRLLND